MKDLLRGKVSEIDSEIKISDFYDYHTRLLCQKLKKLPHEVESISTKERDMLLTFLFLDNRAKEEEQKELEHKRKKENAMKEMKNKHGKK